MKRNKATGGSRLQSLVNKRFTPPIPFRNGIWLDCYSQIYNTKVSGTITTRVNEGNLWFVSQVIET